MTRLAYSIALLAAAACSSAARAPTARARTAPQQQAMTRYFIVPHDQWGSEGRHSSSHSSARASGELQLVGDGARIVMHVVTTRSKVRCNFPPGMHSRQACDNSEPATLTSRADTVMTGTAERRGGTLHVTVRDRQRSELVLTCEETLERLECTTQHRDMFGTPARMVFSRTRAPSRAPMPSRAPEMS